MFSDRPVTASENLSLIKKNAFSEVRLLWFFLFAVSTGYIRVIILSAIRALRKKEAKPVGFFFSQILFTEILKEIFCQYIFS